MEPDPLPTLVIGYGSLLRSDDAVGQHAAAAVDSWRLPNVRALLCHQLTPELAEPISEAHHVLFVDAAADLDLEHVTVEPVAVQAEGDVGTHAVGPSALLGLARALYGKAPGARLVAIPVATFDLGDTLSPKARRGLSEALDLLRALLQPAP